MFRLIEALEKDFPVREWHVALPIAPDRGPKRDREMENQTSVVLGRFDPLDPDTLPVQPSNPLPVQPIHHT
jgi:hypothetical protein